jgi:short-subunit dehydrogenase
MEGKKLAVVTGASSGIGYELAKVFAEEGFDLMVVSEDERIFDVASEFSQLGAKVLPVRIDLSTTDGTEAFFQKIRDNGLPVDVLAVNAGVGSGGEFVETSLDKEINLIHLNVLSAVILTKHVLKDMVARGEGRILFTSSIAAETPGPYEAVYAASKAFLQSFAIALRHEVKDKGVVITALQPGATDTEFFERAEMLDTPVGEAKKDDPAQVARQGFDALMAGKAHVVAGSMMNKMNVAGGKVMSEKQGAKMQARETKPNSVH